MTLKEACRDLRDEGAFEDYEIGDGDAAIIFKLIFDRLDTPPTVGAEKLRESWEII